ncbi:hypothetical protein ACFLTH_09320 [Bacteroidota bacterium]
MIAVINYDREASKSLNNLFGKIGIVDEINFTDCEEEICSADKIILPDTSNIRLTLRWMQFHNFYNLFRMINKPILGIAGGAVMMCESISNITGLCLGLFPVRADCSNAGEGTPVRSELEIVEETKLLKKIKSNEHFYFNNKCKVNVNEFTSSKVSISGGEYSATFEKSNLYGVMFDIVSTESGSEKILKNFTSL